MFAALAAKQKTKSVTNAVASLQETMPVISGLSFIPPGITPPPAWALQTNPIDDLV